MNQKDIPVIKDALGPGVHFQPLRLDMELGEWVPWHYLEYPDQPQTAGSYLFEPGSSVHTLVCPDSNTEGTVVLFRVHGANINVNEDGTDHSILDVALIRHLTDALSEAQGLGEVTYVGGGAAGLTTAGT